MKGCFGILHFSLQAEPDAALAAAADGRSEVCGEFQQGVQKVSTTYFYSYHAFCQISYHLQGPSCHFFLLMYRLWYQKQNLLAVAGSETAPSRANDYRI
jgi:hypothetical protein